MARHASKSESRARTSDASRCRILTRRDKADATSPTAKSLTTGALIETLQEGVDRFSRTLIYEGGQQYARIEIEAQPSSSYMLRRSSTELMGTPFRAER